MSGFFGCVSRKECVADVFYGTDYHSHLGTKKAGMAFYNGEDFVRSIHSIESAYFRNKFEPELGRFIGSYLGIGVISDMESHIQGRYRERLPYGQGVLFFFNSDRQLYLCCP